MQDRKNIQMRNKEKRVQSLKDLFTRLKAKNIEYVSFKEVLRVSFEDLGATPDLTKKYLKNIEDMGFIELREHSNEIKILNPKSQIESIK